MALIITHNERTDFDVEVTLTDKDGDPIVPTTAFYHIHDDAAKTVVRDWTAFTATLGVATIHVAAADLGIIDDANETEDKVLTVHGTYSGGREFNEEYKFRVKNLEVIPKT